jgi:hypothetical protein
MYAYLIKNGFRIAILSATIVSVLFFIMASSLGPNTENLSGNYSSVYQYDLGLIVGLLLIIGTIGITIYFTFKSLTIHKVEKGYLRKVGLIVGSLFIFLMLVLRSSSKAQLGDLMNNYDVHPWINGFISSGIIVSFIAVIIAISLMVFMGIRNIFKA